LNRLLLLVCSLLFVLPSLANAAEFLVGPGGGNKVVFVSRAASERFEGKTSKIEGKIVASPDSLGDSITVHLEVDLESLDTGIGLRNKHMRENHLETKKYPKAVFDGASLRSPAPEFGSGKQTTFDVEGTFTLHGVSRRIRIKVVATYSSARGRISFQTVFPVALADYQISRPQFLWLKLADVQEVRVSAVATAAP
jgi:polyisoprenoid-binding protein YceI